MSALFGFVVGYIVGARAGSQGFERVEQALRDIRDSEEFRSFLDVLRDHAKQTAQVLNDRLQQGGPVLPDFEDLAAQARARLRGGIRGDERSASQVRVAGRRSRHLAHAQVPGDVGDVAHERPARRDHGHRSQGPTEHRVSPPWAARR
jgi:hypothetical protein